MTDSKPHWLWHTIPTPSVTYLLPTPGDFGPGPGPNSMMGGMHANFNPMMGGPQGMGTGSFAPGGMGVGQVMGGYAGRGPGPSVGSMMGMPGMGMMQNAGGVLQGLAVSW